MTEHLVNHHMGEVAMARNFPKLETPTVRITVESLERPQGPDGATSWRALEVPAASDEYVYTVGELHRILLAYGAAIGCMLIKAHVTEFRLVARGLFTGRLLGVYGLCWAWDQRRFIPRGRPMLSWPPVHELPQEVVVGAALHAGEPLIPFPPHRRPHLVAVASTA
ncbi:hypothetical protein HOS57_gp59 [Streptomyces phage AbbeyMikolon]|uniref:Uncharacterized protein n=1 Tax=Streptomyces phage AbbeyMikolon TaxID=2059880 RepID=A0A2H5BLE5_9CAUD|nr:hypothetical protein HOS57_gp59 [Streptomyces phage AbbeyMikolon]AUG87123.1 hypothetical protein SEA_ABBEYMIKOLON_53 [Streptomyces phage AbbeyMikolon]